MALSSLWRRRIAALVTAAAVLTPTTLAFAQLANDAAKTSLADADKAVKAKDWKAAVASFDAANKTLPSEPALYGLADAYYQNGQLGEAFAAYTEWNDKYGSKATQVKKQGVDKRLKELTDKTGGVTITVSEFGAAVLVDDKQVGTSPLPSPLRLTAGPHRIKVTKDGFIAFDQSPNVAPGTTTAVDAKLVSANQKTKVTVTDKSGQPTRVFIDGVDRGPAPWVGELDAGLHEVSARGTGFAAPMQKITVERGTPVQVDLASVALTAPVRIATTDRAGIISIDGNVVGEGSFQGELAAGTHSLKITRDGYDPLEEQIVVQDKDPVNKNYTLTLSAKVKTEEVTHDVDRPEGIYGGFVLGGFLTPAGTGNSIEQQCDNKKQAPTLKSCDTPDGLGAGLGGFIGYHWDPVGIELFVGGNYDVRTDKESWSSAASLGGIGTNPARDEEYLIRRIGITGLLRARLTKQWHSFRITFPFGAGISYRVMTLQRTVTGTAAPTLGVTDKFNPDSAHYVSPTIELEPSIAYRLTPGVAISLGLQFVLEAPSSTLLGTDNPHTTASPVHRLGASGISTPSYELAANVQTYFGPVIGLMFGP